MIICRHTGEYYIGATTLPFERRFQGHIASLRGGYGVPLLQACWDRSHPDWFSFVPLFECPASELRAREREAIARLQPALNRYRPPTAVAQAIAQGVNPKTARYRARVGKDPGAPVLKRVEIDGEQLTLRQVAERFNLPLSLVRARYSHGCRDRSITRPRHSHTR